MKSDNLSLDGSELGGKLSDGSLESGDLCGDCGLLGLESSHDSCELGDCFLRSGNDSVDNSLSLWCIITEFTYKDLFLSGHPGELPSQVSDENVNGFLLLFDGDLDLAGSFLLDFDQFLLLLEKSLLFFSKIQFFLSFSLIDFVGILISLLFSLNGFLSSLGFEVSFFLGDFIELCLLIG